MSRVVAAREGKSEPRHLARSPIGSSSGGEIVSVATPRTSNSNRYLVFMIVAGAHALAIGVLVGESRSVGLFTPTVVPLTAFILRRPARLRSPLARPRLKESTAAPITEPIILPAPVFPMRSGRGPIINWKAEAKRSVARILERKKRIGFGFPPGGESAITLGVPSAPSSHHAGESYRIGGGELIYWTTDHCYLVSDPPSPFLPEILQNARLTRPVCD